MNNDLTVTDRFTIFEQLNLHQRCIDKGWGREQVDLYNRLYWSEAKFNVNDLRTSTFEGLDGMKQMFDYAHSVFPMDKWFHSMGAFEISGSGDRGFFRNRKIKSPLNSGNLSVLNKLNVEEFEQLSHLKVAIAHLTTNSTNHT